MSPAVTNTSINRNEHKPWPRFPLDCAFLSEAAGSEGDDDLDEEDDNDDERLPEEEDEEDWRRTR